MESKIEKSEQKYMEESKDTSVSEILSKVDTVGLAGLGGAEEMSKKLREHEEIRKVILDYIEEHLVPEIDFGQTDKRSDKLNLKKAGAEKVCRLFNTSPRWIRDYDTWEMLGKPSGTVCYICQIIDNDTKNVIGEGRGAERVGNKDRDANKTIKNAEKCALVDAALYTFMLSEKFTQDGGAQKIQLLASLKREFMADVSTSRTGVDSELSDLLWLNVVFKDMLHKSRIDSVGEMMAVRKSIFEDKLYDFSTGKRI